MKNKQIEEIRGTLLELGQSLEEQAINQILDKLQCQNINDLIDSISDDIDEQTLNNIYNVVKRYSAKERRDHALRFMISIGAIEAKWRLPVNIYNDLKDKIHLYSGNNGNVEKHYHRLCNAIWDLMRVNQNSEVIYPCLFMIYDMIVKLKGKECNRSHAGKIFLTLQKFDPEKWMRRLSQGPKSSSKKIFL